MTKSKIEQELEKYPMQDNVVDTIQIFAKVIQKVLKDLEKKKQKDVVCWCHDIDCEDCKDSIVKWSDVVESFGECKK